MSELPGEMWFGTTEGQWPIHCWESEAHAMTWLREAGTERRRLWRARVVERTEYKIVEPKPYLTPQEAT